LTVRVLVLDRSVQNPYSTGLCGGLRAAGAQVRLGGPFAPRPAPLVPVYPRYGMAGHRLRKALEVPCGIASYIRLLMRYRPDVVHFQWAQSIDALYLVLARSAGARVVFTEHNPVPERQTRRWSRFMRRRSDATITHGETLRAELQRLPSPPRRSYAVDHGNYDHAISIHPREEAREALEIAPDTFVVLFAGQLEPRKGVDLLIRAFGALADKHPKALLVICGTLVDSEYQETLRRAAVGIKDAQIRWLTSEDGVPSDVLDRALSAADVVALPFLSATQSGSVILAMTHGRAIVTSRVGEVGRVVERHGILLEPGDEEGLRDAISHLIRDEELTATLGSQARAYALRELSWERIARTTLEIYEGVMR
jgi:beta-1,4-mannosyltransferase